MSTNKVKTQLKTCEEIYLLDGRPYFDNGIALGAEPIGGSFTTATLPSAAGLDNGLIAYNSDLKRLVVTLSGSWV